MRNAPSILITGAAGRFGYFISTNLFGEYKMVLTDILPVAGGHAALDFTADLSRYKDVEHIFANAPEIETVLHLGGKASRDTPQEEVLKHNINGTSNVFECASRAGVKRIIFASSIEVIAGYPDDLIIQTSLPARPRTFYGAGKAYCELLGRYYADQRGTSVHCIRFGRIFYPNEERIGPKELGSNYVSIPDKVITSRDALNLVRKSILAPAALNYGIFHGLSDNRRKRLDLTDTITLLGYSPIDDAYDSEFSG